MALSTTPSVSTKPNAVPTYLTGATGVCSPDGMNFITYAGVCAATLAAPAGDGQDVKIISLTAHAHTVTTPANVINGADDTATFGAQTLNYTHLVSFGGQWIQLDETGITLSEV